MSRVRRHRPRCRSATWISVCGYTHDVVIYSRFHRNPFRSFGVTGVEICPFSLFWLLAFYNSLKYRTSRDKGMQIIINNSTDGDDILHN